MRILITGFNGFIGRNLCQSLKEIPGYDLLYFARNDTTEYLASLIEVADVVVHLAGENRPVNHAAYQHVNVDLTKLICNLIGRSEKKIPLIFTSSIHALSDTPYGISKQNAEKVIEAWASSGGKKATIYRLPSIFGKWCRPNYNSVVATFCHNIANQLPIEIYDPNHLITISYIDDVVTEIINAINDVGTGFLTRDIFPKYSISLGELAEKIISFDLSRRSLIIEHVGSGLMRALYATYMSYVPIKKVSYPLPMHSDSRGSFVEILKTMDSGQFSYFIAKAGVTRGGHFHHSKTEKFLVVKGRARFRFKNIVTDEVYEITTSGENPEVVESLPGWAHDITNLESEDLVVFLWANELFHIDRPDTFPFQLNNLI